jgi:hypothetical protein
LADQRLNQFINELMNGSARIATVGFLQDDASGFVNCLSANAVTGAGYAC